LIRRHFFLVAALTVLVIMVVIGAVKVVGMKGAGPGGGGQAQFAQGGGQRGPGGPGGRRGGFGGPTMVSVTQVRQHVFKDTLDVLGVAKGRKSVTLSAAATQLVDKVRFVDGQHVARGAVLVELKNTEQDAGVAQSQARLVQAQRQYERYKKLAEQGWVSKSALDQYEAAYRSAQADLTAAKAREADRVIRAPFSGVVGLSDVAPGALVNPGAPIVTLDDISSIRVDFQVPERSLSQVRPGQTIQARIDAYPGETFQGRITHIDTRVDERTRAITARAEFANPDRRLKPGMMVRVSIARGERNALSAPETAVSVQGDSAFVYVLHQQGQRTFAEQRPVSTGLRQDNWVEITDGARAGERIVADGLNKIQAGQPVRIAGQAGAQRPKVGARPVSTSGPAPEAGQHGRPNV
jgi:membrane fusion protein (multidrug efflux system)